MEVKFTEKEKNVICSFFPNLKNLEDRVIMEKLKSIIANNSRQSGKMNSWNDFFKNFVNEIEKCNV